MACPSDSGADLLSDVPVDGVETIPLQHDWPGWFAKFELFRPDIEGDLLYFDIDTVITGDLKQLEVGQTTMLSDFYHPQHPCQRPDVHCSVGQGQGVGILEPGPAHAGDHHPMLGDQGYCGNLNGDVPRWPVA